ncbi:hypothetical protein [Pseudomonas sp. LP_7_YM]|uniref:hypothetical protein n=1 Tax=Pseudomonas sp. LP_7_YM TaxID=2485137 RepID=UPI00105FC928|nr:hypothetical protein [Pseudomonas sp. LP_7_YM]
MLLVFVAPVDQSLQRDVLDCSLYTQLAANRQFNKFTHYRDWQATLIKALAAFGWLRLDFAEKREAKSESVVVARVLHELLPDALDQWRGERLDNVLASIFDVADDNVLKALHERCVEVAASNTSARTATAEEPEVVTSVVLQIGFVLPSREMILLCMAFDTLERVGANPFAQRLEPGRLVGEFRSFAFVGVLDDLRYSLFRQRVDTALAEKRAQLSLPVRAARS